jgi:hypothetical protein
MKLRLVEFVVPGNRVKVTKNVTIIPESRGKHLVRAILILSQKSLYLEMEVKEFSNSLCLAILT